MLRAERPRASENQLTFVSTPASSPILRIMSSTRPLVFMRTPTAADSRIVIPSAVPETAAVPPILPSSHTMTNVRLRQADLIVGTKPSSCILPADRLNLQSYILLAQARGSTAHYILDARRRRSRCKSGIRDAPSETKHDHLVSLLSTRQAHDHAMRQRKMESILHYPCPSDVARTASVDVVS